MAITRLSAGRDREETGALLGVENSAVIRVGRPNEVILCLGALDGQLCEAELALLTDKVFEYGYL